MEGKILHLHSLIWKIGNLLYIYAGQFGNSGSTGRVGNLAVLKPLTDKAHRGLLLSQNHSEHVLALVLEQRGLHVSLG